MSIFKRLFCKHKNTYTITNFYGDAINYFGCRSWKRCLNCNKIIKSGLDEKCSEINNPYSDRKFRNKF